MALQNPLSPTSYFTTWNSKAKKKNLYPLNSLSFKKIIALYLIVTPICPLCEVSTSPYHTHGLSMSRVRSQAGLAQARSRERHPVLKLGPSGREHTQDERKPLPDLPCHSCLYTHFLSPSLSVSILMIALTLERPTVQMHTHFTVTLAC